MPDSNSASDPVERVPSGRNEDAEVEGHRMKEPSLTGAERVPGHSDDDEPEVEGHMLRASDPERRWDVNRKS
jgi:hypothetical protein